MNLEFLSHSLLEGEAKRIQETVIQLSFAQIEIPNLMNCHNVIGTSDTSLAA